MIPRLLALALFLLIWQGVVMLAGLEAWILPSPLQVLAVLAARHAVLMEHAAVTVTEILLGMVAGSMLGIASALLLAAWRPAERWLLPVLVASQAVPVFALAPLLVLWFGYGMPSKVAMASLIIYFPVASAFLDGLRRTDPGWVDLARTMGASPLAILLRIRVPAALPALASGLKVAAAVAPIGAVIGEWVGSSAGLGYLMLQANARMQTSLMFAALATLAVLAVTLHATVELLARRLLPWQSDDHPSPHKEKS